MANPIIHSVKDARAQFAGHGYITECIAAFDAAGTVSDKARALRTVAKAIGGTIITADVSVLLQLADDLEGTPQPA